MFQLHRAAWKLLLHYAPNIPLYLRHGESHSQKLVQVDDVLFVRFPYLTLKSSLLYAFRPEDRSGVAVSTVISLVTSTLTVLLYYNYYTVYPVLLRKLRHLLKRNVELIHPANDCLMTAGSMFFCYREYDQDICIICVAEVKRYNMTRHYHSKQYNHFDSAYPGKGERLNVFKTRFDAYVGEAKRVSLFVQGASHLNEATYRIYHFLAQHQVSLAHAEVFKKGCSVWWRSYVCGFSEQRDNCRTD